MAKRRRKKENPLAGQINFYKAMAVLGLIIAGTFIYYFLDSAPHLTAHPYHIPTDTAANCLECHLGQTKNVPIMPHRPMEGCTYCHTPQETEN